MEDIILDENENMPRERMTQKSFYDEEEKKEKRQKRGGIFAYWLNLLAAILIVFSLLSTDLVLFAASGPFNIFAENSLRPEMWYILAMGLAIVAVACFFFSILNILLNLLVAMSVYLFTEAFFSQFANFSGSGTDYGNYIAVALSVFVFALLWLGKAKSKFFLCLAAVFCLWMTIWRNNHVRPEFSIVENGVADSAEQSERLIYIMLPNAASYSYINQLAEGQASAGLKKQLMDIMLGFYVRNGMKIYPNAYVTDNNQFVNAGSALNYAVKTPQDFMQTQVLKDSYWQFSGRSKFEVYLKNNQLMSDLKAKGYQISAYQSRGIHLCQQNNQANVYRCVSKTNSPVNIDNIKLPAAEKTEILLAEWLESTGWFKYGLGWIYDELKSFYNPAQTPMVGLSYQNLYVINSLQALDILTKDIAKDHGRNAYFIYLDLPADMYVYDDLCRLKSNEQWVAKFAQPWAAASNPSEHRNAWLQQNMCLYGKLEQLMQRLKKAGLFDQTTVIIAGLSGLDDLYGKKDKTAAEDFMNGKLVQFAIKTPGAKQLIINKSICSVEDILQSYFRGEKNCPEFERTTLSKTTRNSIKKAVNLLKFSSNGAQLALQKFHEWYKGWHKQNYVSEGTVPAAQPQTDAAAAVPASKNPLLQPLEEKNIGKSKLMKGEVKVAPEAKTGKLGAE